MYYNNYLDVTIFHEGYIVLYLYIVSERNLLWMNSFCMLSIKIIRFKSSFSLFIFQICVALPFYIFKLTKLSYRYFINFGIFN